jgi:hypothetical protein
MDNGAGSTLGMLQIRTGSPTFVQLFSDVAVKGLTIDNGCALVLNGHTINIGGTLVGDTTEYPAGTGAWIYRTWGDVSAIPEPGTCLLFGTGAVGLLHWLRRRRMRKIGDATLFPNQSRQTWK